MKKTCFFLLFAVILGLSACGKTIETSASPAQIAAAIVDKLPNDVSMAELDADRLASYYSIDMEKVEDFSVYIEGSGGFADEIALFKMKSKDDIDAAKAAVKSRADKQRRDFDGYVPEEVEKIDNNSVTVRGNYLLFVISDDAKTAVDTFKSFFK